MFRLALLVCLVLSATAFVARDINEGESDDFPDGIEISRGDTVIGPLPDFTGNSFAGQLHSKFGENIIGPLPDFTGDAFTRQLHSKFGENIIGPLPDAPEISNLIGFRMSMIGPIPE